MKKFAITSVAALLSAGFVSAAAVSWTTSAGLTDAEVSTAGTGVFAYYFNSDTARTNQTVNGVNFVLHTTGTAPAGLNFNGSFNNPENVDCYQVAASAANVGLNAILDGQNWGGAAPLTVTGLTVGQQYQVQLMLSDDRTSFLNARNYAVSDSNSAPGAADIEFGYHSTRGGGVPVGAPVGAVDAKIFTATFTADGTTQDFYTWLYENATHGASNAGSQVNAIQLRVVPEPASFALLGLAGLAGLRRRRA